jgi:hypothetical protein
MLQTNGIDQVCDWRSQITTLIGARAYIMRPSLRSKKMARTGRFGPKRRNWTSDVKNGPDRPHGKANF